MANTKVVVAGVLFLLFSVSYASDLVTSTTPQTQTEEKTPEISASVLDLARPSVQIFHPDTSSSSSDASTLQASFIPVRIDILNVDGRLHEFKADPHFRFLKRHHHLTQRLFDLETLGIENQGANEGKESDAGATEVVVGTEPVGRMIRFRFGGRRMGFHRGEGGCPMMKKMMKEFHGKSVVQLQFHGDHQEKKEDDHHHYHHLYHPHGDRHDDEKKIHKKNGLKRWLNDFLEQF